MVYGGFSNYGFSLWACCNCKNFTFRKDTKKTGYFGQRLPIRVTSTEEMKEVISHQEGFFDGVRGAKTYYQCWLPEGEPKSVLLVVHGLAEHSGRYMHIVNYFVPLGYAIYALDHLGHGKSEGIRVFVNQFEDLTDPLKTYFNMVRVWQPGKSIILVGHSLGGLIGSRHLLDHQANYSGAILSGPLVRPSNCPSPFLLSLLKIVAVVAPKIGVRQLKSDVMSTDREEVQGYVDDPLVHPGKVTAGMSAAMFAAMEYVARQARQITLPLIIVQGSADATVDPAGAQQLYHSVGSADKTLKMYEGYYHEVFNEPEPRRTQVFQDIQIWLESHL